MNRKDTYVQIHDNPSFFEMTNKARNVIRLQASLIKMKFFFTFKSTHKKTNCKDYTHFNESL